MCNQRFSFSEVKDKQLKEEFMHLYYHDDKSKKCRTPCVKNTFTSRFVHRFQGLKSTWLFIVFEDTIKMTNSKFSVDEETLLIRFENSGHNGLCSFYCFLQRLGGSVSSGRTLLWVLVTIFTASQVFSCPISSLYRYRYRYKQRYKIYLPLVVVTDCHFRIWIQRVTFET